MYLLLCHDLNEDQGYIYIYKTVFRRMLKWIKISSIAVWLQILKVIEQQHSFKGTALLIFQKRKKFKNSNEIQTYDYLYWLENMCQMIASLLILTFHGPRNLCKVTALRNSGYIQFGKQFLGKVENNWVCFNFIREVC